MDHLCELVFMEMNWTWSRLFTAGKLCRLFAVWFPARRSFTPSSGSLRRDATSRRYFLTVLNVPSVQFELRFLTSQQTTTPPPPLSERIHLHNLLWIIFNLCRNCFPLVRLNVSKGANKISCTPTERPFRDFWGAFGQFSWLSSRLRSGWRRCSLQSLTWSDLQRKPSSSDMTHI